MTEADVDRPRAAQPTPEARLERSTEPARQRPRPPAPGGHEAPPVTFATGAVPAVRGTPPVATPVPAPGERPGRQIGGVQLAQRAFRRGDRFGWPANAALGKPEGEVDTRRL